MAPKPERSTTTKFTSWQVEETVVGTELVQRSFPQVSVERYKVGLDVQVMLNIETTLDALLSYAAGPWTINRPLPPFFASYIASSAALMSS